MYCSRTCQARHLGAKAAFIAVRNCATCNVELVIRNRRTGLHERVYCSKKCYGIHLSVAYQGDGNPGVNRSRSEEETEKRRASMKKKWQDKQYCENVKIGQLSFVEQNGHWGGMDEESFAKRRSTCRVRFGVDHPWMLSLIREKCETTSLERHGKHSWQIAKAAIPTSDTRPELRFASMLIDANVPYLHPFDVYYSETRKFEYDFYMPGKRVLVEVDGDYWHAHPDKYSTLNETQKRVRVLDFRKNELAEQLSLKLVRVWESDVMNNKLSKVIEDLQ